MVHFYSGEWCNFAPALTGRGVPQDDAEAVKWYRMAAEQGYAGAQNNLGILFANGEGVLQDYVSAYMWLDLAAAQAHEDAQKNQEIVAKQMPPDQIAKAKLMAREWMSETLNGEVTGTDPNEVSRQRKTHNNSRLDAGPKVPGERIGYEFSNMMFGEYCMTAYVELSKASVSGLAAMALGEESCGMSGAGNETVADAEAEALEKKCKSATIGCRIIFTTGNAPVYGHQTGSAEWIAGCARKYRSFEPSTGLYTARSGNKRRCRLP